MASRKDLDMLAKLWVSLCVQDIAKNKKNASTTAKAYCKTIKNNKFKPQNRLTTEQVKFSNKLTTEQVKK